MTYRSRTARLALGLLVLGLPGSSAFGGEISTRIEKVATTLSEGFRAHRPGVTGQTLAVFTFQAPSELEKRRVGFAISEMLVNQFVAQGPLFKVVERTELKKVLEEHSLSLTGAVDSDSAVKVGKLLGAKFAVVGSVETLGSKYQINSRIIEIETGEVIATSFEEMDSQAFEVEAKGYLVLVPKSQAIGIYVTGGRGFSKYTNRSPQSAQSPGLVAVVDGRSGPSGDSLDEGGVGLRYAPTPWLTVDGTYLLFGGPMVDAGKIATLNGKPIDKFNAGLDRFRTSGFCASLNWTGKPYRTIRSFIGAGFGAYWPAGSNKVWSYRVGDFSTGVSEGGMTYNLLMPASGLVWRPFVRVGAEWMIQDRFGIGLWGKVFLTEDRIETSYHVVDPDNNPPKYDITLQGPTFYFPFLAFDLTASLYF